MDRGAKAKVETASCENESISLAFVLAPAVIAIGFKIFVMASAMAAL